MYLTGIEIVNMEEGEIRAVECSYSKGKAKIHNGVQGSFYTPFFKLTPKTVREFLRQNKMKSGNILLILPDSVYKSKLWSAETNPGGEEKDFINKIQVFVDENRDELGITGDAIVKKSYSGTADSKSYGIVTSVSYGMLSGFYKVFKGMNLKYVLTPMTAYSLINYKWSQYDEEPTAVLDLKEKSLTLAVYYKAILVWTMDLPYIGPGPDKGRPADANVPSICETASRALNAAGSNRFYPSRVFVTGVMANIPGMDESIGNALGVHCEILRYRQDSYVLGAELSTLIGVMRGIHYADEVR